MRPILLVTHKTLDHRLTVSKWSYQNYLLTGAQDAFNSIYKTQMIASQKPSSNHCRIPWGNSIQSSKYRVQQSTNSLNKMHKLEILGRWSIQQEKDKFIRVFWNNKLSLASYPLDCLIRSKIKYRQKRLIFNKINWNRRDKITSGPRLRMQDLSNAPQIQDQWVH